MLYYVCNQEREVIIMNTVQDAYRIVFNDILNKDVGLFVGRFDATNGNKDFMHGINTVMEFIAINVSEQDYEDFQNIWLDNFIQSIDKANSK